VTDLEKQNDKEKKNVIPVRDKNSVLKYWMTHIQADEQFKTICVAEASL
jgi:hypothetical protein